MSITSGDLVVLLLACLLVKDVLGESACFKDCKKEYAAENRIKGPERCFAWYEFEDCFRGCPGGEVQLQNLKRELKSTFQQLDKLCSEAEVPRSPTGDYRSRPRDFPSDIRRPDIDDYEAYQSYDSRYRPIENDLGRYTPTDMRGNRMSDLIESNSEGGSRRSSLRGSYIRDRESDRDSGRWSPDDSIEDIFEKEHRNVIRQHKELSSLNGQKTVNNKFRSKTISHESRMRDFDRRFESLNQRMRTI